MNLKKLEDSAHDVANLLRSLANEKRLMILCQLAEGEKSVGELAKLLDLRQTNTSQQLALLRKDNIVTTRREAQTIYYALVSTPARQLITLLHDLYCGTGKKA
ncbi:MAG: transcriptional regulator [Rhodospirillaceae bacterium]|nr:MAG: transcriptional regulator [Rhodospirillaceae bacterium]